MAMTVRVDPPIVGKGPLIGPPGNMMYRLAPRPGWQGTFMDNVAGNLNKWLQGDLSFLAGAAPQTSGSVPVRHDRDKRKRDAMADVLDGKSK